MTNWWQLRQRIDALEQERDALQQQADALVDECYQLRTLIDHLPDYIFIKDVDSRFVINNQAHAELLGYDQFGRGDGQDGFRRLSAGDGAAATSMTSRN